MIYIYMIYIKNMLLIYTLTYFDLTFVGKMSASVSFKQKKSRYTSTTQQHNKNTFWTNNPKDKKKEKRKLNN